MNVVRGLIVVGDFERLARVHHDHVRDVLAALLLEMHGCRRGLRSLIAGRHIDHDVLQRVVRARDDRLGLDRRRVLLGAGGLLRHVDRLHLGRRAGERDRPGH